MHAERLRSLLGDALGEDAVDAEREVAVLLDGAERDDEPVVAAKVVLDLHPVQGLDVQRRASSTRWAADRSNASAPTSAASCRPAGRVPSAIPHGIETAGLPERL